MVRYQYIMRDLENDGVSSTDDGRVAEKVRIDGERERVVKARL